MGVGTVKYHGKTTGMLIQTRLITAVTAAAGTAQGNTSGVGRPNG